MKSDLASRLYLVHREAGKPLPSFSDDDVIDFQITEALVVRAAHERGEAQKKQEREAWKAQHRQMPG